MNEDPNQREDQVDAPGHALPGTPGDAEEIQPQEPDAVPNTLPSPNQPAEPATAVTGAAGTPGSPEQPPMTGQPEGTRQGLESGASEGTENTPPDFNATEGEGNASSEESSS